MTSIQKHTAQPPIAADEDIEGQGTGAGIEIAQAREVQEVQAAMTIAKRFPRNEDTAYTKVIQACKRRGLAESAQYEYPRGGQTIKGPSIRLAETLARYWGNLQYGVAEVARRRGYSECIAFAWDLESNVRPTLAFTVRHQRDTRQGIVMLTDERDINELILNQGARRQRNCLLKVIPADLIEDAIAQCERTLAAENKDMPLSDRAKKMAAHFLDMGVTVEMIEAKLGHKVSVMSETEYTKLRKLWQAIKDGATTAAEAFSAQLVPTAKEEAKKSRAEELKEKMKAQAAAMENDEPTDEPT